MDALHSCTIKKYFCGTARRSDIATKNNDDQNNITISKNTPLCMLK